MGFLGVAALTLGLGFTVLSGSVFLAAISAVLVFLIAAYLSWERHPLHQPARRMNKRRRASAETGYVAIYGGTVDGSAASGGDCGFGEDGGGSFGGDGGGAGGC